MTIKKLPLLVLSFAFFFFALSLIFSPDGIVSSYTLKKRYEEVRKDEEAFRIRIENLEREKARTGDGDWLDDIALSLGYNREGESVYYFDEPDEIATESHTHSMKLESKTTVYGGMAVWKRALIALALTAVEGFILLILSFFKARRELRELGYSEMANAPLERDSHERREYNNYDDYGI